MIFGAKAAFLGQGIRIVAVLALATFGINFHLTTAHSAAADIGVGPAFNNPRGIAEDPDGNLIVADFGNGNIYRVDPITGDRVLVSDNADTSQGPSLAQPAGIVVLADGRIFVSDLGLSAVYEIDAAVGTRTLLAGQDGSILAPFGLATGVVNGKTMLVVADTGNTAAGEVVGPVLVDPDTGAVSQVPVRPGNTVLFNDPRAIAVLSGRRGNDEADDGDDEDHHDRKGNRHGNRHGKKGHEKRNKHKDSDRDGRRGPGVIMVANFGIGEIIAVNPVSGVRKIISQNPGGVSSGVGNGPAFGSITDMALSEDGDSLIVVDLGNDAIVEVDLKSGDRTIISTSAGAAVGTGEDFRSPHGIEVVEDGLMITDFGFPGILFVNEDGNRSPLSITPVQGFVGIRAIDVLASGDVLAADFGGGAIFTVDPVTGARTLISSGPPFNGPVAAIELSVGTLAVAQFQNPPGMFFVDSATGERSVLTGFGIGTGPEVAARGFILDPNDPNRILATSFNEDAVIAVDVTTGDRTFVSKAGVIGGGPALNNPLGIAVDPADGTIYVSDIGAGAIFRIAADGSRTILSDNAGVGGGPAFSRPFGLSFIDGSIFVADRSGLIEVDVTTGNRTMVSPGGVLFTVRKRDANSLYLSNFGPVQGIEIVDKATGVRTVLSNATTP